MSNKIYIGPSKIMKAGRGVFAAADIRKNEVIEICPVIIIARKDGGHLSETILQHYIFDYTHGRSLMALGYGSLYNHNVTPNAKYEILENHTNPGLSGELYITAIRRILKGEEIYINYGAYYDEKYKMEDK